MFKDSYVGRRYRLPFETFGNPHQFEVCAQFMVDDTTWCVVRWEGTDPELPASIDLMRADCLDNPDYYTPVDSARPHVEGDGVVCGCEACHPELYRTAEYTGCDIPRVDLPAGAEIRRVR